MSDCGTAACPSGHSPSQRTHSGQAHARDQRDADGSEQPDTKRPRLAGEKDEHASQVSLDAHGAQGTAIMNHAAAASASAAEPVRAVDAAVVVNDAAAVTNVGDDLRDSHRAQQEEASMSLIQQLLQQDEEKSQMEAWHDEEKSQMEAWERNEAVAAADAADVAQFASYQIGGADIAAAARGLVSAVPLRVDPLTAAALSHLRIFQAQSDPRRALQQLQYIRRLVRAEMDGACIAACLNDHVDVAYLRQNTSLQNLLGYLSETPEGGPRWRLLGRILKFIEVLFKQQYAQMLEDQSARIAGLPQKRRGSKEQDSKEQDRLMCTYCKQCEAAWLWELARDVEVSAEALHHALQVVSPKDLQWTVPVLDWNTAGTSAAGAAAGAAVAAGIDGSDASAQTRQDCLLIRMMIQFKAIKDEQLRKEDIARRIPVPDVWAPLLTLLQQSSFSLAGVYIGGQTPLTLLTDMLPPPNDADNTSYRLAKLFLDRKCNVVNAPSASAHAQSPLGNWMRKNPTSLCGPLLLLCHDASAAKGLINGLPLLHYAAGRPSRAESHLLTLLLDAMEKYPTQILLDFREQISDDGDTFAHIFLRHCSLADLSAEVTRRPWLWHMMQHVGVNFFGDSLVNQLRTRERRCMELAKAGALERILLRASARWSVLVTQEIVAPLLDPLINRFFNTQVSTAVTLTNLIARFLG